MEVHIAFAFLLLVSCFATASYAHNVSLSTLNQSLIVSTSTTAGQVLRAGVDQITITWAYNTNLTATASDTNYTTVEAKLCYAPVSQTGQDDRKTDDNNLDLDKTCPFVITDGPYQRSDNSFVWTIPKDTPNATYFVRVYTLDADDDQIGYGQSTNGPKTSNLFLIDGTVSDQKGSAWSLFGNSFGYRYVWLLTLFLV
ncbi:high-affinity nitrate transporter 3.1-like protein [Tanacetum coccineum]